MREKILFVVPYPYNKAPSQRLKFEQYYSSFTKAGITVTHESFMDERFWDIVYKPGNFYLKIIYTLKAYLKRYGLLFKLKNYSIVYVHLWGTPFGLPLYEWFLRKLSKKLIYDIDDLVYLGNTSENNKSISLFKSSFKINFLIARANEVLVSTEKLHDYVALYNTHITTIPATIDLTSYILKKKDKLTIPICIGWSGSPTTSKYLHILDGVLKNISEKFDLKIQVMGDPTFTIDGLTNLELIKWSADTEAQNLQNFDIGLHPLPDEEWVYGKSGGKLVQYMAAGVPIIASAIAPNYKAIKDGFNGFLVKDENDWVEKLSLLIQDSALRIQMGRNSRITAEQYFSVEANLSKYINVFSN